MTSADAIARYLTARGEGRLSPTQLHHLLYFVQGYALVLLKRPAFADDIVAGPSGPEVPTLAEGDAGQDLPPILPSFIDMVWEKYGAMSADELARLVCDEPPWRVTPRAGVIGGELLADQFRRRVAEELKAYPYPVPDPAEAWQAEEDLLAGRTYDLHAVAAELRQRRPSGSSR
jgi:uncharacterized phage-associated protein